MLITLSKLLKLLTLINLKKNRCQRNRMKHHRRSLQNQNRKKLIKKVKVKEKEQSNHKKKIQINSILKNQLSSPKHSSLFLQL
jgi:hypothetical protein